MKKLAFISLGLFLALAGARTAAAQTGPATMQDIQRLQYDLHNLDDSLSALSTDHPRYREFQDRANQVRDEVTYLKVQIQRGQRSSPAGLGASQQEVADLRRSISTLQGDIDTALDRRFSGRGTLAVGTEIQVRLEQPLSSRTAQIEDRFDASVAVPVEMDGRVMIPAGTRLRGIVNGVERAERPAKSGRLDLTFDSIYLDERTRTDLRSRVVSVKEDFDFGGSTGKHAGIGAVLGGVLGQVIGGTKGALVGVLIGAGGGIATSKGDDVELPAGSALTLRLEAPLDITR
jgi:hypothetical protein